MGRLQVSLPDDYQELAPRYDAETADIKPIEIRFVRRGTDVTGHGYPFLTIKTVPLIFTSELPDFEATAEDQDIKLELPIGTTSQQIHDQFCQSHVQIWSFLPGAQEAGFDIFDVETGIGKCVNPVASNAMFLRQVDTTLIIVETYNPTGFTTVRDEIEKLQKPFANLPAEEKWRLTKDAANAVVAEQTLLSVRLNQDTE